MSSSFCTTCGTPLAEGARFCSGCGSPASQGRQASTGIGSPSNYSSASAATTTTGRYRLGGLATAIAWVLGIGCVTQIASAVTQFSRAALISRFMDRPYSVSMNEMADADNAVAGAISFDLLFTVAGSVLLVIWAWRATKNLDVWNLRHRWSPGWAIGGWFVPVASFWIPYQVVQDAWRSTASPATADPATFESEGSNLAWTLSFVTFWISSLLWLGAGRMGDELSDILASDRLGGVAALVGIVASIAAIVAIRQISRRHDERR